MISNALRITGLLTFIGALTGCGDSAPDGRSDSEAPESVQFLFELPLVSPLDSSWTRDLEPDLGAPSTMVIAEPIASGGWKPLEGAPGIVRAALRMPLAGGPFVHDVDEDITGMGLRQAAADQTQPRAGEVLLLNRHLLLGVEETTRPLRVDYPTAGASLGDRLGGIDGARLRKQRVRMKNGERRGVLLPAPMHLTYQVEVPSAARLEFAAGVMPLAIRLREEGLSLTNFGEREPLLVVRLEVESGASSTLWTRSLAENESMEFHDASADLSPWAGQTVRLHFEVKVPQAAHDMNEHVLVAWAQPVLCGEQEDTRPNIVFVVLDTLRADRLGCYGGERGLTPHLDSLAQRGVRFQDAMSAASWTLPSHASLFTSTFPSQHGLWKDQILPTSLPTVAEVLHTAGYRTAAFAEGGYLSVAHGFSRGHEVYNSKSRDCSLTFAAAQEWIARQDSPYFAFVHTYQVHSPYDPPAEYRKRFVRPYSGSLPEVVDAPDYPWGHGGKPPELEDQRYITDLYDAEVAYLDAELGRFLESLEESDSLDNTLLLITSDHGEEFFEHGAALHGMSLYQEQLHVPLILHWPGHLEGGLAPAHGVHAVDVAPTLLAAAGVSAPKHWVGEPLRTEAGPSTRPLFMPMKTLWSDPKRVGESAVSLREGKFKYITYPAGLRRFDAHSGASLFDLAHDPGEARNLLDPEQALEWGRKLSALYERFPAVQSGGVAEHDAATQAELQKLGYAGQDNSKE